MKNEVLGIPMVPIALAGWCARALPQWTDQTIGSITELGGGWESDVFGFELVHTTGTQRLALRVYTGADGSLKAPREHEGIRRLHQVGYPVPAVYGVEPDAGVLGRPFLVMEWVDGVADRSWPDVLRASALPDFVRLLTDLHALDWRPFVAARMADAVAPTLQRWRGAFGRYPMEGFADVLAWLDDRRVAVAPGHPAVVHWDFHPGNVLVSGDGTATVVDWTEVTVADVRFDLAWTELLVAMAVDGEAAAAVRAEYERQTTPLDDMHVFEVAAALRRLFSVVVALRVGPEALGMRSQVIDWMQRDLHHLGGPYATVETHTGIAIPAARELLGG